MATRRQFLTGTAVVAGAAITGFPAIISPARAAEKITVFSPFGFTTEYSDLFNAYSGGHFARQGLDAKVLSAMGVQSVQQLVAGQGQFIRNAGVDIIKGVAVQNLPLICISTIGQGSTYHVVSLKDKPVNGIEDLKGKTVGILTASGGASSTYIELLLTKAGLHKDDLNMVVTGNSPAELEYVKQGRIDCFVCTIDVVSRLQRAKAPIVYWSTDKYVQVPGYVHVTRRDIVEKQPDLVQRYMRAIKASVAEIMTTPLATIFTREAKDFPMSGLKDMDEAVALQKISIDRLWLAQGRKNLLRNVPGLWQSGVAAMKTIGYKNVRDPTYYYTNRFIDAA